MKIIDKTPLLGADGKISLLDRIQGTLKYGLSWYPRLQAQDKVIPVFENHLGRNFILMRNVTLGGTEIELPLILIGPPGVLLVNVISEKGVFRAREDEWGSISGDQFVPARVNHVARTARMGQVLQVFLDRVGLKGMLKIESVLLSAEPGTHIESVRPIVRVVMSDALERFAISLSQTRAALSPEMCAAIAQVILSGKPLGQGVESGAPTEESQPAEDFGFAQSTQDVSQGDGTLGEFTFQDEESAEQPAEPEPAAKPKPARKGKKRILGMTPVQLAILAGILLAWLCVVIVFVAYFNAQLNA